MKQTRLILFVFSFLGNAFVFGSTKDVVQNLREIISMSDSWRFILRDDSLAYCPSWQDSGWREISLPHDWAFENGYSEDGVQRDRGGYASGGIGWYRKTFSLSALQYRDKRLFLSFEAIYMNSEVWFNGHYLGKRPYGYISFEYEITSYVKQGLNVISVRVDNSLEPSARWYHGCGIYGNVHLAITSSARFATGGTVVVTNKCDLSEAHLSIRANVDNYGMNINMLSGEFIITDFLGKEVFKKSGIVMPMDKILSCDATIFAPSLWNIETPQLYTLTSRLKVRGKTVDETQTHFGIRSIEWHADTGFWLNGRNVKIRGVCEHLEGGPIGASWTENMMRWKIRMLKNMGCNAIRTAHNPQLPVFYDICDEMGMLVLDEIFDGWGKKAAEDYGKQAFEKWWERDLRDWIRRDRNHPCIIAYSVGNETHGKVAEELVRICHEEDSTRHVTSGHSGSEFMDILGVNGHSEKQSFIRDYKVGDKAFIGTETPHTWQVRGYYRTQTWYRDGYPNKKQDPFETPNLTSKEIFHYEWASPQKWTNKKQHFNSSYDNGIVRINARQNMEVLRDLPWYSGSFRWTGFDYLGEAGYVHGGWPFRAFMGGVIDLAGFPKDHYYLYQSQWTDLPMVHLLPHWTHPEMENGIEIPVWAYTTGDSVELFLNGRSLGVKKKGQKWSEMQCEWMVPWKEGSLEAVAYRDGKEWARTKQKTSGVPSRLILRAEDACFTGDKKDMYIFRIAEADASGTIYPYGENRIYLQVTGKGEIYSIENGNPVDIETNYHASSKKAFFGLLAAFVRYNGDPDISLFAGGILGDKSLKMSKQIAIDVSCIHLYGGVSTPLCEIYYTTDGTMPTIHSRRYFFPFSLEKGGEVKALVMYKGKTLFMMEEKFGENEGLYWGKTDSNIELADIQAEKCVLNEGYITYNLSGFQSQGYVVLRKKESSLEFYQENDGGLRIAKMDYSYTSLQSGKVKFQLQSNGKVIAEKECTILQQDVGKWKTATMDVSLVSGANTIKLVLLEGRDVCIDWLNWKD